MPESVLAAVLPAPGAPPEVREYPLPEVEPGAVLLKTIASEVCGTDVHLWHGRLSGVPYPLIPGHVSVGEVAEVGGSVVDVRESPLRWATWLRFWMCIRRAIGAGIVWWQKPRRAARSGRSTDYVWAGGCAGTDRGMVGG
jgi:hypothetical protein